MLEEAVRANTLFFYLSHSYAFKHRAMENRMLPLTEGANCPLGCNPQVASSSTGHLIVPKFGLLLHIGPGPDGVFGVQLLKLLEKDISELIRFLCIESVQQFLTLVVSELMTEVVQLIAAKKVLLLDLLQGNIELLDLQDQ